MRKISKILLLISILGLLLSCGSEISGDYSYQPQYVVKSSPPDSHAYFLIENFSVLKTFYAAAGRGEKAFLDLEDGELRSPIEHIYIPFSSANRRDYFLMLLDYIDEHYVLMKNEHITLDKIQSEPTEFNSLNMMYSFQDKGIYGRGGNSSFSITSSLSLSPTFPPLPNGSEPITIYGDDYRIDFYDHTIKDPEPRSGIYPWYAGYLYYSDTENPIMIIRLYYKTESDASRIREALPLFSEFQVMTVYEAMMNASVLENE
jgi:hypothetical protein